MTTPKREESCAKVLKQNSTANPKGDAKHNRSASVCVRMYTLEVYILGGQVVKYGGGPEVATLWRYYGEFEGRLPEGKPTEGTDFYYQH